MTFLDCINPKSAADLRGLPGRGGSDWFPCE